jgi:hypothetical protein
MAYDLFSIPAMSAECERAFSSAKRLISDERYNLKPDIIEADQCIKSWCKNRVVDTQAAFATIAEVDDELLVKVSAAAGAVLVLAGTAVEAFRLTVTADPHHHLHLLQSITCSKHNQLS